MLEALGIAIAAADVVGRDEDRLEVGGTGDEDVSTICVVVPDGGSVDVEEDAGRVVVMDDVEVAKVGLDAPMVDWTSVDSDAVLVTD